MALQNEKPPPTVINHVETDAGVQTSPETVGKPVLKIDLEFQNLLPPRTTAEREFLAGWLNRRTEIPIIDVWGELVLSDPNVYQHCRDNDLPFDVREVRGVTNRLEAETWIIRRQLAQRNLTPLAVAYFRGRLYLAEKCQGSRTDLPTSGKNCQKLDTTAKLAKVLGVSRRTIGNDPT